MSTSLKLAPLALACLLSACASPSIRERVDQDQLEHSNRVLPMVHAQSLARQAGVEVRGGAVDANLRAQDQASRVVIRRSPQAWIGSVTVPMGSGEKLPSVFHEPVHFNFEDGATGGRVSVKTVAERITALTGVPVRVKSDVFAESDKAPARPAPESAAASSASAAGLPTLQGGPLPVGGLSGTAPGAPSASSAPEVVAQTSASAVSMRWKGSLEGFLNHITDLLSLSWEYREGVVVIERFRTEVFEVALLDGEAKYSMGLNASDSATSSSDAGGGKTDSNATASVSESGKSNAITSVLAGIRQIIGSVPGSNVVLSEGSGRIAVTTTKETMSKVREFVRSENDAMLRQAQIQFDIYSVRRTENDERGIDWQIFFNSLSRAYNVSLASPASLTSTTAAGLTFSVLNAAAAPGNAGAARWGDTTAILNLLSQFGTSTQHRPVSLLTLNRQWARKASLNNKAYVAETVPGAASSTGVSVPGLKTATVTTGDRYIAQPYILDNNTVVLKFAVGLSSLVDIVDFTSGSGSSQQRVQTPETNNIIDQATVALRAGQVLAITGLSRIVATERKRTLTENAPTGFGGSRGLVREREDFVIFVRPTIL